jgi:eukaryotic-like serine/threonine-protein kinase
VASDSQVLRLLDEILELGKTPDEVCRDCPELLPEVRQRWQQFQFVDAQVRTLFPGFATRRNAGNPYTPRLDKGGHAWAPVDKLPDIEGYEVQSVLGRGGMGVVFRARHLRLDRLIALKMMLDDAYAGPRDRDRFQREAEAVARLRHPNVVQIHDIGDADGRPYFTMELVDGGSLAEKLAGTPLPSREAAELAATLAGAVQAAHDCGIVHRDLKPGNVLLTSDGMAKITDFGLARQLNDGARLTQTGAAVGTPSYMAPEQANGQPDEVGPAVDVYALGAILYELLTGRPPFKGATAAETIHQVIFQEPAPPSRLNDQAPRDLETICLKCLQKDSRRRYESAVAFGEDLARFLRGEAIAARPEGFVARLARRVRRRPALSAAVTISSLLLFVLFGGGLWVLSERSADRRAKDAADAATEQAAERDVEEMIQWLNESSWPQARAALERAKGRVGDRGSAKLKQQIDQGQRDIELGLQLDAIVLSAYDLRGAIADTLQTDKFVAAFRDFGFGEVHDDPKVVAARIRESHIRTALVVALDQWISFTGDSSRVKWILDVLQWADPDSTDWRARAGDPANWTDEKSFAKLLATAPIAARAIPILLASDTEMEGGALDTIPRLKQIQAAYPGDLRVNLFLGEKLALSGSHGEAIRYFQAVLAVRPSSASGNDSLGQSLHGLGRNKEAVEQLDLALKLAPTSLSIRAHLVSVLWQLGRDADAEVHLKHILAIEPAYLGRDRRLRTALIQRGRVDEAVFAWKVAIDAYPQHDMRYGYAEYCLFLGLEEDYRRERRVLAGFGNHPLLSPFLAERIARACLLRPLASEELRLAGALAEQAVAADRSKYAGAYPYFCFAQGLAEYRQGCSLGKDGGVRLDLAISAMRGDASKVLGPAPRLVLAMALHQKGQAAEARKTLAAAVASHDWRAVRVQNQDDWTYHVLRREAESQILPDLPNFLEGKYEPKDNDERLAFLGVSQFQNRQRAVARLYVNAFAADPILASDLKVNHGHVAARAAALVGCGRGADAARADEAERTSWRKQALTWLRADLAAQVAILDRDPVANGPAIRQVLTRWQSEPELACVRETVELDRLHPDERKEFAAFWADLAAALARTGK